MLAVHDREQGTTVKVLILLVLHFFTRYFIHFLFLISERLKVRSWSKINLLEYYDTTMIYR